MPAESLMNSIHFRANGYQGDFIPSAFVCNYWLSQERWVEQSPSKQQVISILDLWRDNAPRFCYLHAWKQGT